MRIYSVSANVPNTAVSKAFFICDSGVTDPTTFPSRSESGYTSADAFSIMTWFDSALDTSAWRKFPQGCYNSSGGVITPEVLTALIEQSWSGMTNFKALPTNYTQDTTLSTTATIEGNVLNLESSVSRSSNGQRTDILSDSPFAYTISSYDSNHAITFIFIVLPDDAVVNGKLALTTNMKYAIMNYRILTGDPGNWQLDAYRGVTANVPQRWIDALNGTEVTNADDDPYSGDTGSDEPSEPGGGGTEGLDNEDPESDPNPVPSLPTLDVIDTGFITLFRPSLTELRNLASYMWGTNFDIDLFKKLFADPMECILGLSIVPVAVGSGGSTTVKVGNISTGVSMTKAASQYVEVNCGTIKVTEKWKSYLDYSPYTKISIFLPFIGTHELDIDLIVGNNLGVVYHFDVLSGGCVAFVTVNGNVRYEFSGQCAMSVPVTARDFTQTIIALGNLAAAGTAMVASGGMSAPVSAAAIGGAATSAANTASTVISSKPRIQKSGNIGGSNGIIGSRKPYIIIERPKLCAPASQNMYTGYPSYITYTLGELSGFTQVQDIHLDISCTDSERNEIMSLLREGVIL